MSIVFGSVWPIFAGVGLGLAGLLAFAVYRRKSSREMVEVEIPSPHDPTGIDRTKANLRKKGFAFDPYRPKGKGLPLSQADLRKDEELLMVERKGRRHLFLAKEMAYHHLAQYELAGEPYMVSF